LAPESLNVIRITHKGIGVVSVVPDILD